MKREVTAMTFVKYLFYGICWGCVCLVAFCLMVSLFDKEALPFIFNEFPMQVAGSVLVGIACGTTGIVYQFQRIPGFAKVLIHFVIGMGVFYPTAIHLGWFPFNPEHIGYTVMQLLISCGIFFAIWACFYFAAWLEARKINSRLKEMERDGK